MNRKPTEGGRTRSAWSWALVFSVLSCGAGIAAGVAGCGDDGIPEPWPVMESKGSTSRSAFRGGVNFLLNPEYHKPFQPDAGGSADAGADSSAE